MNVLVIVLVVLLIWMLLSRKEQFTDKKGEVVNQKEIDLTLYDPVEDFTVSNDVMEQMVLETNKRVSEITGLCTYVVETTSVKKYRDKVTGEEIYRCMFMIMKRGGFPFGFSVSSDIKVINDPSAPTRNYTKSKEDQDKKLAEIAALIIDDSLTQQQRDEKARDILESYVRGISENKPIVMVYGVRTQPLGVNKAVDETVFTTDVDIYKFDDFSQVRRSELDAIKSKPLTQKVVRSAEEMYGRPQLVETKTVAAPELLQK